MQNRASTPAEGMMPLITIPACNDQSSIDRTVEVARQYTGRAPAAQR